MERTVRRREMTEKAFMNQLSEIRTEMAMMESMLGTLAVSAYNGIKAECIGNSLEILAEYMAVRSERLDDIRRYLSGTRAGGNGMAGESLSDRCGGSDAAQIGDIECWWEKFAAGDGNLSLQSGEVAAAYARIEPHLEALPDNGGKALLPAIREIGAASRKQVFAEGMKAAAGKTCGSGDV